MDLEFLSPVDDAVVAQIILKSPNSLGTYVDIHTKDEGFPDLEDAHLAILGVQEDRNADNNYGTGDNLKFIRKKLYELFPGKWNLNIVDLGNIAKGQKPEDTYYALLDTISELLSKNIIPIILGGGQEMTYVNYRAYDDLEQSVNITVVDNRFDLGTLEDDLSSQSYMSKIIMQEPNNLFNYCNVGYQTYFNDPKEIQLFDNMYFDCYRLGVSKDLESIEPAFRNADIISIDLGAIRRSDAPGNNNATANGFSGDEICAISRYAGLSDKVTSFGIYEYNSKYDENHQTAGLIAQMLWYFIEGVSLRVKDYPFSTKENYQKFTVIFDDDEPIVFYKSNKSGRWWMEINVISNNKYQRHALIPCTYRDYEEAMNQNIPDRWYKAMRKMV